MGGPGYFTRTGAGSSHAAISAFIRTASWASVTMKGRMASMLLAYCAESTPSSFPRVMDGEGLIIYAIALTTSLLGRTILAVRLPTALASAGTVFAIFWLGQLLFGRDGETGRATPWRGLLVGGVGAGLLAVSLSQTVIGRTAFRVNFLPLLLCLCLCLLWEGWRSRSWRWVALAGAIAGLLAYTYIAARFTPFLFLILGLSFLVPWGRSEVGRRGRDRDRGHLSLRFSSFTSRLRTEMPLAVVFVGVAGVVAAPILIYFALNPDQFFVRSDQVSVFQSDGGRAGPLWTLVINVWEHLLAFGIRGDPSWRHNYSGQPLLNVWEAFFFWIGVGDGRVAMETARYSSAASLAGAVVVTGHAVPR